MDNEEQPSETAVNEGVTNGDAIPSDFQDVRSGCSLKCIMETEEQPSETAVNKSVTNGDATIPSDFQDAPVIQPPLSDLHKVASQQDNHCQRPLQAFWSGQLAEIKQTTNFKTHSLPLARIKKIMKADSDVPKRVAGEAPLLLAKAGEMFIRELTLRAWLHTEEDKRKTLQKEDVTAALASTEVFDFLVADGSTDNKPKGNGAGLPPPKTANDDDYYGDYYPDDYSPPWSPEPPPAQTCAMSPAMIQDTILTSMTTILCDDHPQLLLELVGSVVRLSSSVVT